MLICGAGKDIMNLGLDRLPFSFLWDEGVDVYFICYGERIDFMIYFFHFYMQPLCKHIHFTSNFYYNLLCIL